ncbi:MAG: ATP-binding protein, partial [Chitinophagales bacterium]
DRFVVLASAIDIYGKQRLKNLRNILIVAFSISLIILIIAGNIYAKRALLPISKLIKQVNNITANSMNLRLDEGNRTDEIAQLASTFNQMLDRLETAFKVQRNFIANASHEMRTPLTSITGQLEVLLMQKRSDREYTDAINSVLDDIKQMNNTSNRLLMLAQASAEVTTSALQPIRIDDLLWQARSEILKHNPDYKISIAFADWLDETHMLVKGNALLLNSAIANLMDNACKYAADKTCTVQMDSYENNIALRFSDNGIGIEAKDLENITQPFFRGRNIGAIKGHGIGLSLVDKIVSVHNGTMQIHSEPGNGTVVTILIPVFLH